MSARETTLEAAAALMLRHRVGSLVVLGESVPARPVGIVTETDLDVHPEGVPGVGVRWLRLPLLLGSAVWTEEGLEETSEHARRRRVREVMSSPCVTAEEDEEPMQVARRMIRHDIRHVPVLRGGSLTGIVTGFDFLTLLAGLPSARGASDLAAH